MVPRKLAETAVWWTPLDHVRVRDCMHAGIVNCGVDRAAQVMTERAIAHLVVIDPASGYPIGILSTLDVAAAYGRQPHARR